MLLEISPVLITGFRRPILLQNLIDHLLLFTSPSNLYVSIDGMIGANPAHTRQIALSREIARSYESIGVHTLLPEKNLGCYLGNREAISWFFSKVNSGIILEDDMWPNSDFLNFATQGLRYYEQNFKVGSISGTNIVPKGDLDKFSSVGNFRFSKYSSSWGWATWSNRWGKFIASANNSEIREITHHVFTSRISRSYWRQVMFETYQNENDSWAYRWLFTHWSQEWLALTPNSNFIVNLGFGPLATHTTESIIPWWIQPPANLNNEINLVSEFQSTQLTPNRPADAWLEKHHFRVKKSFARKSMMNFGFRPIVEIFDRVRGNK
jgi:hypothetical protein